MIHTFTNKNIAFTGCSITVGEGLTNEKLDENNYANIIAKYYKSSDYINVAKKGNSNYQIFLSATKLLRENDISVLFVQWSGLKRLWVFPNLQTSLFVVLTKKYTDYENKFGVTREELRRFAETYFLLMDEYHLLTELIEYSLIIEDLCRNKCELIFINGMIPWTKDILTASIPDTYNELSEYTKFLLHFNELPDDVISEKMLEIRQNMLKLDHKLWANMFDPLITRIIDTGSDDAHPGPRSHCMYATEIINYIENK